MSAGASDLLREIAQRERELDALRRQLAALRPPAERSAQFGVVRCRLGDWSVAFCDADVDEVVMMAALTVLPEAPPWVMGLLLVGHEQIPVVDLAAREATSRRDQDPQDFIVLVRTAERCFGFVVDELVGLERVDGAAVHQPSAELPFAAHVTGVATIDGEPVLLLAVEPIVAELLQSEETA